MSTAYSIAIIAVAAACTFFWRVLPFAAFGGSRKMPAWLERLGKSLPPAIMTVLVVYCLKDAVGSLDTAAMSLAAIAATAVAYLLSKSTFIGIIVGTAAYMILIRVF